MTVLLCAASLLLAAQNTAPAPSPLDTGFNQMYNLQFDAAHRTFAEYEQTHPDDPMGPVSDAAAYLFAEFDRLHVLESELFVDDDKYENRDKLQPNPQVKVEFDNALARGTRVADAALAKQPRNPNALLAKVLVLGLTADYLALIEKKDLKALSVTKEGRTRAEELLAIDPTCYDAYIAVGIENYLLSLKPAPVRWFLRVTGAQTDKQVGLEKIRLVAEKGHLLKPYARMLLAVAALRDKDNAKAQQLLRELSAQYPNNRLYASELAKLKLPAQPTRGFGSQ
jgi:hypothetical protein